VTFKETFALPNLLLTARRSECLATESQQRIAASKLVQHVVAEDAGALWAGLAVPLQETYAAAGRRLQPPLSGQEYALTVAHDWERRGAFIGTDVDFFEDGALATMRSSFRVKGLKDPVAYLDRVHLTGCLVTARSEECLAGRAAAEELARVVTDQVRERAAGPADHCARDRARACVRVSESVCA
jgi:hypothetical protein